MARIAINGFGRIGRAFFRSAFGRSEFDIVAINDLSDTATLGYLLTYDTVYGRFDRRVEARDHTLSIDGTEIRVLAEKDPAKLPWKDLGVDIVVESTGFFTHGDRAKAHLDAGAKQVVITAPADGDVMTALVGVNDEKLKKPAQITCNASCTTNSVAPVLAILLETIGIEKAWMVTVHSYTASQRLVDGPDAKDPRRGRAAAANTVPPPTGAAEAVIQALPELAGKFDAAAVRVPTISGSLSVISAVLSKGVSVDEVNELFRKAAASERWEGILTTTSDPVVSSDIVGQAFGSIVDTSLTKVVDGNFVSVSSWYDNEAGYTTTLVEHVRRIAEVLS